MSHPYSQHKEVHAGRKRAHSMANGFKRGGGVHSDEKQDKKLISKMISDNEKGEMKVEGKASGGRLDKFARGGRAKHKAHTKINIIVAPKGGDAAAPAPGGLPPGGPPMMPPKPPMMPPPGAGMGAPPGMPPGGPPPMMRKVGGRVYQRGGKVPMKAGADSGEGRIEKAKAYGLKAKKAD